MKILMKKRFSLQIEVKFCWKKVEKIEIFERNHGALKKRLISYRDGLGKKDSKQINKINFGKNFIWCWLVRLNQQFIHEQFRLLIKNKKFLKSFFHINSIFVSKKAMIKDDIMNKSRVYFKPKSNVPAFLVKTYDILEVL